MKAITQSKKFAGGLSLIAMACAMASAPTFAKGQLEEVVVTATKKAGATDVQDVNASVTALGREQLADISFTDLGSLSNSMPNVKFEQVGTTPGYANFTFRGLGINSSIPTVDPTVGVFVDGVYQGVNAGQVFETFDLEGIEILRGPQGVLFGRNVTGGAVVLNTTKPSFDKSFDVGIRAETGLKVQGDFVMTGAIVDDVLAGKLAVYLSTDEGWFTNLYDNTKFGGGNQYVVRPGVTWRMSDDAEMIMRAEFGSIDSDDSNVAAQNHAVYSRDSFDFLADLKGYNQSDWKSFTNEINVNVDFGNGTITNIAGYREYEQYSNFDFDGMPTTGFHATSMLAQDQLSNELRYTGSFDKTEVTVGAFYFTQNVKYIEQRELFVPVTIQGGGDYDHEQWAIFGNADYSLSDQWTVNAGLRYSSEDKSATAALYRPGGCDLSTFTCTMTFPNVPGTYPGSAKPSDSWGSLSAKFGAQFQPNDDTQIYGYYAKSFRSGGYNIRQTAAGVNPGPFDQEEQDTFELGWKQDFNDNTARINAAVFYNMMKDIQREANVSDPETGVAQNIVNAGDIDIWGFEFEGQFFLSEEFMVSVQAGYTDAEYGKVIYDISGDGAVDEKDMALQLPRLSPWTYGLQGKYQTTTASGGDLTASLSATHTDEAFYDDKNLGRLAAIDNVMARLTYTPADSPVTYTLYGKNLLNEAAWGGDTHAPDIPPFGGDGAGPKPPATFSPLMKGRVIGVSARMSF